MFSMFINGNIIIYETDYIIRQFNIDIILRNLDLSFKFQNQLRDPIFLTMFT